MSESGRGARSSRVARLLPLGVAALTSFVVLGPAFGPGVVLSYDLAWSPDSRLTPFASGTTGSAPRALPSDAVAVALGEVLGAGVAQVLVLWATLVLAGAGAARLVGFLAPEGPVLGRVAAAVASIWNPFVLERLVVGHWTVLLAYAAVPHLWVACVRARRGSGPAWAPAVGLAACGVGGANATVVTTLAVLPVLAVPKPVWRALGLAVGAALGVSCVWALPALHAGVTSAPEGVAAFAARADTPWGTFVSLVTGGGFWNEATHPSERSVAVIAFLALALATAAQVSALRAARAHALLGLALPGVLGLLAACLSALDPFGLWATVVLDVPGGGILRDSQKLIAPWVAFGAAGAGVLVGALARRWASEGVVALLVTALPVALLPSLAWGVGGRVDSVQVPADLRRVAAQLSGAGPGDVGLLPWSQYRRYAWNDGRVSLTLVPRMVDQRVIFDDSLPLATGSVAGEDPAASRVSERLAGGVSPVDALAAEGVRWVVVEKQAGQVPEGPQGVDGRLPTGARVSHDGPNAMVIELPARAREEAGAGAAVRWGWGVTGATWLVAAACCARAIVRRRRDRLVS